MTSNSALNRRAFTAGVLTAAVPRAIPGAGTTEFVKGICSGIFPPAMPYAERCRQAKAAGFDAIEFPMSGELSLSAATDDVMHVGDAARRAGVSITSLWVSPPLARTPLNSPDSTIREQGREAILTALDFAKRLDCGALLIVPGRVGNGAKFEVGYETTWQRFTAELKKVLPAAESAKVLLTMENVSNRFLVSPLEMRAFVDQFESAWLKVHFDTGNVMYFGYPQDWILTLGARIRRVHVKDRKAMPEAEQRAPSRLLDGDVDWKEVMRALSAVGYRGPLCPEIGYDPNDATQLLSVSKALDKILSMA